MTRIHRFAIVGMLLCGVWSSTSTMQSVAEDHFLTIGGGYSPTGNQVSLEKNVMLFQRLLSDQYPDGAAHEIYFSDGDNPGRDLQYHDPDAQLPRLNVELARVFRATKYLRYQYRSHEIAGVTGPTSRDQIDRWFSEVGGSLESGDRLFIYVTAHGGRSTDRKNPYDTKLYLWNTQYVRMRELAAHLDKLPEGVQVVMVMVQCYAGGFANTLFKGGDPKQGATEADRCGFFATVHNRPAAGCTPDVNEENYQEYSSFFWAALSGQTRTGAAVESCDYDDDGAVSLAEAHAYALLESDTIDISVKTSDTFLRAYSRTKPKAAEAKKKTDQTGKSDAKKEADKKQEKEKDAEPSDESTGKGAPVLLTADADYTALVERASATERAVMDGLSEQLELSSKRRADEARKLAARIVKQKQETDKKIRSKGGELTGLTKKIQATLIARWPELANRWHPSVSEILAVEGDAVVQRIESHASYGRFNALYGELQKLGRHKLDLDRKWAKSQRLLRVLENVALAANLPLVATDQQQARYKRLVESENRTFRSTATPAT